MNIATTIRFYQGTFETIWNNNDWRPHSLIVEIARHYGVGVSVIAADSSPEDLERMCAACDGLIIPGNKYNIDPRYYGGAPVTSLDPVDTHALDAKVIAHFDKAGKPILGICGGHQALNVFYGGTLARSKELRQNISESHRIESLVADRYGNEIPYRTHMVTIEKDSFMYDAYGSERVSVNSYHGMALDRLAPGFRVVARTDDGIVEAIEWKEKKLFATQFHPELGWRMNNPKDLAIFENFFRLCEETKK